MSTARGVLTIVGQVAGAYITGGSQFGAAIGGAVGGFIGGEIDGPQSAQGPRLADTKVPTVAQGAPMPWLEGAQRLPLNPIWISERRELATTTNEGGKGSDATTDVTTYTYEQDVLYYVTGNAIGGIRRIWDNGKLIWSMADGSDVESLSASQVTDKWSRLTIYTGGADQLPDATYEAAVGVGNAPAYRGRGTVFIQALQLGAGGQMPLLTAEVMSEVDSRTSTENLVTEAIPLGYPSFYGSAAPGLTNITMLVPAWDTSYLTDAVIPYTVNLITGAVSTGVAFSTQYLGKTVAAGNSDTPVVVVGGFTATELIAYSADGAARTYTLTEDLGYEPARYCLSDAEGAMVLASSTTGSKAIYRHASGGGVAVVASAAHTDYIQALAIDGDDLWALDTHTPVQLLRYDMATLTLQETITGPGVGDDLTLTIGENSYPVVVSSSTASAWDGTQWLQYYGPGMTGIDGSNGRAFISGSTLITFSGDTDGTYKLRIHRHDVTLSLAPPTLDDVVSRQCVRAGLTTGQIDVTALAGTTVRGMAVTQVTPARTVLQNLATAYLFEAVESAGKVKFVLRGGASARTIPFAELGASRGGPVEPLPMRRYNPLELPARVTIRYANAINDYQDGAETSDRLVDDGNGVSVLEVPIVLTPTEAKRLAEVAVMDANNTRFTFGPVALTNDHVELEPTDVVTLVDVDGNSFRVRMNRHVGSGGINALEGVLDDADAIDSTAVTVGTMYTDSMTVRLPADTEMELLDIPLLRDADDGLGLYVAAKGATNPWPGAGIYKSSDDVTFASVATAAESAIIGVTTDVLGVWTNGNRMDHINTVTVDVGGATLSSVTYDELLDSDAGAYLVGDEIIKARVATLVSAGVYRLSDLMRGQRGTEWAAEQTHDAGERVVALRTSGLRRIALETPELDATRYYRGVTLGRRITTATSEQVPCAGVSQTCFRVVDVRGSRSSGDLTLTWSRRTRLAKNFTNGATPLGEASEAYEIRIYVNSTPPLTILRTIGVTSETATYTAAEQTTDFGSPQASIYMQIAQVSELVGVRQAWLGSV